MLLLPLLFCLAIFGRTPQWYGINIWDRKRFGVIVCWRASVIRVPHRYVSQFSVNHKSQYCKKYHLNQIAVLTGQKRYGPANICNKSSYLSQIWFDHIILNKISPPISLSPSGSHVHQNVFCCKSNSGCHGTCEWYKRECIMIMSRLHQQHAASQIH